MRHYEYKALSVPEHEIRLIRILPGKETDEIRCTLFHERLSLGLSYEALSYSWRDDYLFPVDNTETYERLIVDHSAYLRIGENLASYFRHIRKADMSVEPIWVDAICINQNDIEERSAQVLRMCQIYKLARNVVVWLGPDIDNSLSALRLVKHISTNTHLGPGHTTTNSSVVSRQNQFKWWTPNLMTQIEEDIGSGDSVSQWLAVSKLFNRAWWSRTWVVQEAVNAREMIFMCGSETMDWSSLWILLENIWAHSHWAGNTLPGGSDLIQMSSPGRTILWLRQKEKELDLLSALYHLRSCLSTDPRDKVYGVLGLASDANSLVPAPDYSLTIRAVYVDLFKQMTGIRKDLDWLTLGGDLGSGSELPSWCPNLTRRSPLISLNTSRSMPDSKSYGFCAARDTDPVIDLALSPMSCAIRGFFVDKIDGIGRQEGLEDWTDFVQPQSQRNAYNTDTEAYRAIWTTIVADQDFEGTKLSWRAPDSFGASFAHHARIAEMTCQNPTAKISELPNVTFMSTWYVRNRDFCLGGKTIRSWTHMINSRLVEEFDESLDHGFERRMRSTVGGRRLGTTGKGFFGIFNNQVRRGDHVCIFFGGRMPVIIRPAGDSYLFIGECYIHGLMFGRAMDEVDTGAFEPLRFVLV